MAYKPTQFTLRNKKDGNILHEKKVIFLYNPFFTIGQLPSPLLTLFRSSVVLSATLCHSGISFMSPSLFGSLSSDFICCSKFFSAGRKNNKNIHRL